MAGSTFPPSPDTQVCEQNIRLRAGVKHRQCDGSTSPAVLRADFQFSVLKTFLVLPTTVIQSNKPILHLPTNLALPT